MFPREEPARRRALKVASLATGLAEKGVSLFYERRLHEQVSEAWAGRCQSQLEGALGALEADWAERDGPWWFGERIGHADIVVATALRYVAEVHAGVVSMAGYPALAAHAARCEALQVFKAVSQPFVPPT